MCHCILNIVKLCQVQFIAKNGKKNINCSLFVHFPCDTDTNLQKYKSKVIRDSKEIKSSCLHMIKKPLVKHMLELHLLPDFLIREV